MLGSKMKGVMFENDGIIENPETIKIVMLGNSEVSKDNPINVQELPIKSDDCCRCS